MNETLFYDIAYPEYKLGDKSQIQITIQSIIAIVTINKIQYKSP